MILNYTCHLEFQIFKTCLKICFYLKSFRVPNIGSVRTGGPRAGAVGQRAVEGVSGAEEGAVEGHGQARRRGTGARGGGRTRKKTATPVSRKANGRGARKKRAAVFDEEEDERIDLPGAGGYIAERITPGASHQPGVKTLYSRCVLPTGSKGPFTPGACYQPGVKV